MHFNHFYFVFLDFHHFTGSLREAEIQAKGRKALIVTADVSQEEQVQGMVDKVVATLGGLDVVSYTSFASIFFLKKFLKMVANAGICFFKPLLESTPLILKPLYLWTLLMYL
jgi:NAD(P)-dependent dehydrogenase (short-subunit alcohol dehydrogenase family)